MPQSRGGTEVVFWDQRFHEAFHAVFLNMTPAEQHIFLDIVNKVGCYFNASDIVQLRNKIMRGVSI